MKLHNKNNWRKSKKNFFLYIYIKKFFPHLKLIYLIINLGFFGSDVQSWIR